MKTPKTIPLAKAAILTVAEIKAAVEAFERGETNVLDALDAIAAAVAAYRAALIDDPRRSRPRRRAA